MNELLILHLDDNHRFLPPTAPASSLVSTPDRDPDRSTLLSALLKGSEVTLDFLVGHALGVELSADLFRNIEEQPPADFDGNLRGVIQWKEDGSLFTVARHEHRLIAFDQFGEMATELTDGGSFHSHVLLKEMIDETVLVDANTELDRRRITSPRMPERQDFEDG